MEGVIPSCKFLKLVVTGVHDTSEFLKELIVFGAILRYDIRLMRLPSRSVSWLLLILTAHVVRGFRSYGSAHFEGGWMVDYPKLFTWLILAYLCNKLPGGFYLRASMVESPKLQS